MPAAALFPEMDRQPVPLEIEHLPASYRWYEAVSPSPSFSSEATQDGDGPVVVAPPPTVHVDWAHFKAFQVQWSGLGASSFPGMGVLASVITDRRQEPSVRTASGELTVSVAGDVGM